MPEYTGSENTPPEGAPADPAPADPTPADPTPQDYGTHHIVSAELLSLPQWTKRGLVSARPPDGFPGLTRRLNGPIRRQRLVHRYHPYARPGRLPPAPPLPPPPPPLPPIAAVGVMDVGQGNCNLLFNQALDAVTYYDVGYPLWFYVGSLPPNIGLGPIMQNQAGNLEIVLSHWDWDHWRLGHVAGLNGLPWRYPNQPVGPTAANFMTTLPGGVPGAVPGGVVYPAMTPFLIFPNYTLYQCQPAGAMMPAGLMNNTGIAMSVQTNLPVGDPAWHRVMLTGDANFDSVPPLHPVYPGLTGITAVHHGSIAHNAAANLPNPVAPYAAVGRIAYSYGVRLSGGGAWVHCYGFPVPAAVGNYHAAGWNNEAATAQPVINGPLPPPNRGNIRMGNQGPLPVFYGGNAFSAFQYGLA